MWRLAQAVPLHRDKSIPEVQACMTRSSSGVLAARLFPNCSHNSKLLQKKTVKLHAIIAMVQVSVTTSSFLQEITAANQHFQSAHTFANSFTLEYQSTITYYRLTEEEIEDLKQKNNTAENWNQILKLSDAKLRVDRIQSCSFHGFVVLGTSLPIHNTRYKLFFRRFWKQLRNG